MHLLVHAAAVRVPVNKRRCTIAMNRQAQKLNAASTNTDDGGRDRDRTCDPYHVKVTLQPPLFLARAPGRARRKNRLGVMVSYPLDEARQHLAWTP
jgi:hypothetical protein